MNHQCFSFSSLVASALLASCIASLLALPVYSEQFTTMVAPSGHKYKIISTGQETRADGKLLTMRYVSDCIDKSGDAILNEVDDLWDLFRLDAERAGATMAAIYVHSPASLDKPAKTYLLKKANGAWSCESAPQIGVGTPAKAAYRQAYRTLISGKKAQALELYNRAITLDPTYAQSFVDRGGLYLMLGKVTESIQDSTAALKLNPSSASAYCNRGIAQLKQNKPYHAISDFNEALKLNPRMALVFEKRAAALIQIGKYENAATDLSFAIRLQSKPKEAYVMRAAVLRKLADSDQQKASELDSLASAKPNPVH